MRVKTHPTARGTSIRRFLSENALIALVTLGAFLLCGFCYVVVVQYRAAAGDSSDETAALKKRGRITRHSLSHRFLEACNQDFLSTFPKQPAKLAFAPGRYCEGYWREDQAANSDLPFPMANPRKFCGQAEFEKMLLDIEASAVDGAQASAGQVVRSSTRGMAPSRLEADVLLGNKEFSEFNVLKLKSQAEAPASNKEWFCWTDALRDYYVKKFNVRPSREFVHYVIQKHVALN